MGRPRVPNEACLRGITAPCEAAQRDPSPPHHQGYGHIPPCHIQPVWDKDSRKQLRPPKRHRSSGAAEASSPHQLPASPCQSEVAQKPHGSPVQPRCQADPRSCSSCFAPEKAPAPFTINQPPHHGSFFLLKEAVKSILWNPAVFTRLLQEPQPCLPFFFNLS